MSPNIVLMAGLDQLNSLGVFMVKFVLNQDVL
jgi:hypothetical protein